MISVRRAAAQAARELNPNVGKYTQKLDRALPGPHTRILYGSLTRKQASVLAQLRTGMARLNAYLHRIGASETEQCSCGHAKELVEHFLFPSPIRNAQAD